MNSKAINIATFLAGGCSLFALTGCQNGQEQNSALRSKTKDGKPLRGGKRQPRQGRKNKNDKKNKKNGEKENQNPLPSPVAPAADKPQPQPAAEKKHEKRGVLASVTYPKPNVMPSKTNDTPVKTESRKLELSKQSQKLLEGGDVSFVELKYNDGTTFADWLRDLQDDNSNARQEIIDGVVQAAKKLGSETIKIECIPVDNESAASRPFVARVMHIDGLKRWGPEKFDDGEAGKARRAAGPNDLAVAFDSPRDHLVIPHKPEGREVANYKNFHHLFKFFNDASLKEYQHATLKKVAEECATQLEKGGFVHLQTHGCDVGFLHFRTRTPRIEVEGSELKRIKNYDSDWKFALDFKEPWASCDEVIEKLNRSGSRKSKRQSRSGRISPKQ